MQRDDVSSSAGIATVEPPPPSKEEEGESHLKVGLGGFALLTGAYALALALGPDWRGRGWQLMPHVFALFVSVPLFSGYVAFWRRRFRRQMEARLQRVLDDPDTQASLRAGDEATFFEAQVPDGSDDDEDDSRAAVRKSRRGDRRGAR